MQNLLSQTEINVGGGETLKGIGTLGLENRAASEAGSIFDTIISTAIGIMTVIASVWFIFQLITAALAWIGSDGDKAKVEEARKKMTNSIIGLVVVIAAIFILGLVGNILGLNLLSPGGVLQGLGI